ncbi:hypothetical protein Hanom_Chr17g01524031 [Helianthus anomalus]
MLCSVNSSRHRLSDAHCLHLEFSQSQVLANPDLTPPAKHMLYTISASLQ